MLWRIKLLPAADWVKLRYHPASNARQALQLIRELRNQASQPPDYIEGIIYSPDKAVVIEGSRLNKLPKKDKVVSFDKPWSPWFYQHAQKYTKKAKKKSFL